MRAYGVNLRFSESYRRSGNSGYTVRRFRFTNQRKRIARALARSEINNELAAYKQERELQARAEKNAVAYHVVAPVPYRLVITAACACGCVKIYEYRQSSREKEE